MSLDIELIHACRIRDTIPLRIYPETKIIFVEDGARQYSCRGVNQSAGAGSLVIVPPRIAHSSAACGEKSATVRILSLPSSLTAAILSTENAAALPYPGIINDAGAALRFVNLYDALSFPRNCRDAQSLVGEFLAYLFASFAVTPPQPLSRQHTQAAVLQIRDYLDAHYTRPIPLHELAEVACLSPFHLHRMFCREVGVPPHTYQLSLRIAQAKTLLAGGYSPSETAAATGFYDHAHFSRCFFRFLRVTPTQFQQNRKILHP